jgi:hypothetical protein
MYVWKLPIPAIDEVDPTHRSLVQLGIYAEQIARQVPLPRNRFEVQRKHVRSALQQSGIAEDIDTAVRILSS